MANGKLARFAAKNRDLRAENRDLRGVVAENGERHNPSTLRKFIGLGIKAGTAYGSGRATIKLQQKGWLPQKVPIDGIMGVGIMGVTAFFHGPVAGIFEEVGDGMALGAAGRLAAYHQLESSEVEGRKALLLPEAAGNGKKGK